VTADLGGRAVDLPDGRRLVIRPAVRGDVPAICALFGRLSPEDRYRRFFSGFRPDEAFVTQLVDRRDDQGAMLLAEVTTDSGSEVVAEAQYGVRPDGDGELAITVDRQWRGWLASYLLDALLELAAARSVLNLRAEVLVQNRPMIALVHSRGYAALDKADPAVALSVISTTGDVPTWPPVRSGTRVLVEVPGAHWRFAPGLRGDAVELMGCPGPARRRTGCPLLRDGRCPLVEGADIVVNALGPDDPHATELLEAHRRRGTRHLVVDVSRGRPATPLPAGAVEVDRPDAEEIRRLVAALLSLPVADAGSSDDPVQPERDVR
jgi:GNAT superfamily N-acetyltransferase